MGSLADYCENAFLDHLLGTTTMTLPSVYLALGTGNTDAGITTEVSGTNYARVAVAGTAWNAASARAIDNNATITFPQAGAGGWGTPDTWGVYDAASAGNCLFYGDITTPKLISSGQTPSFAANTINCSVNTHVSNVGMGTALANSMLDHIVGKTTYTAPTTLYAGFGTTPLTDDATITGEATGGGYARTDTGAFDAASGGASANSAAITFTVSGTWTASLDVIFVSDSLSGTANANLLFFGTIASMSPVSGDTVEIAIGDLDVTLS